MWLSSSHFIAHTNQQQFYEIALGNSQRTVNRYAQCFAKRDQSTAMLSPNYFFIFCVPIKNSQKMAYIMNTLCIE